MKYFLVLVICSFWISNVSSSDIISKEVDKKLTELFSKGLRIPSIDLGNENKFSNIIVSISDDSKKDVSGKDWMLYLDLVIAKLFINGTYNLENIDIPGFFPLFGNGNFSINLNNLKVNFHVLTNNGEADLKKLSVILETSKIFFENLFYDPSVADFVCEILSNTLPDLIKGVFDSQYIMELLKFVINNFYNILIECLKVAPDKFDECLVNVTQTNSYLFTEFTKKIVTLTQQRLIK